MINAKSSIAKVVQIVLLGLVLVAMPAGSWYYLDKGLQYRKKSLAELKDLGTFSNDYRIESDSGRVLTRDSLRKKVTLHFTYADAPARERALAVMAQMLSQFGERPDVLFVGYNLSATPDTGATWLTNLLNRKLYDPKKVYLSPLSDRSTATAQLKITDFSQPMVVIADTAAHIRHQYAISNNQEIGKLIEHTALIIPMINKEEAKIEREKEK